MLINYGIQYLFLPNYRNILKNTKKYIILAILCSLTKRISHFPYSPKSGEKNLK